MSSTTCTHSDELLTLGAIRLLSTAEEAQLDEQINACPSCRERLQEYRVLATIMPRLTEEEMAPSRAIEGTTAPHQNGKKLHLPGFFETGAKNDAAETDDFSGPQRPENTRPLRRPANRRLVGVLSGLAAAVLLVGVIGGFWLLMLSRAPKSAHGPGIPQATQQVITDNPCSNEVAKGVQGGAPACGLVVTDYSTTPETLLEVDPTTGKSLPSLKPLALPAGVAETASLSADQRTLALGIVPQDGSTPTYIQIIWLDTWQLGAKLQVSLTQNESLQSLSITPDGTGIYAVIYTYTQAGGVGQASLRYYAYDRGHDKLTARWSAPLPFVPGDDGYNNSSSFALSADGQTAYLFSAAVNPPQLVALQLGANGIQSQRTLRLPSIASGTEPPFDPNATYVPGDPIYSVYHAAVMFAPQQNKLYLVHAEASDPSKDVLVVIQLSGIQMTLGPDIPVKGAGNLLAVTNGAAFSNALSAPSTGAAPQLTMPASSGPLAIQPQLGLRPYKGSPFNGRDEEGAVSLDGRWIYLSGTSYAPQFTGNSWNGEQTTNLGLLKIDTQTGQVVGQWFKDNSYFELTFGPDGRNLYLFGPPPEIDTTLYTTPSELLTFDTEQGKVVNEFSGIDSSWFVLPLL